MGKENGRKGQRRPLQGRTIMEEEKEEEWKAKRQGGEERAGREVVSYNRAVQVSVPTVCPDGMPGTDPSTCGDAAPCALLSAAR